MNIAFGSMKGGPGKSTLARTLAVELTKAGFDVLLGDLDTEQNTSMHWAFRRVRNDILPELHVQAFPTTAKARSAGYGYDHLIMDLKPRSKAFAAELCAECDVLVIPAEPTLDGLQPAASIYRRVVTQPQNRAIVACVLNNCGSDSETWNGRAYLESFNCRVLDSAMPGRLSYRRGLDRGRCLTEVFAGEMHQRALNVVHEIMGLMEETRPNLEIAAAAATA